MHIQKIELLPDIDSRRGWAKILKKHEVTLYRAEQAGLLKSSKVGHRTVLYTKAAILEWLGVK